MSHLPGGEIVSYRLRVGFGVRPGSRWEQHHDRSRLEHELGCDVSEKPSVLESQDSETF